MPPQAGDLSKAAPAPKPKSKEKEKKAKAPSKPQNDRLKTVVRRLPPNLPEEMFWQSVRKWVSDDTVQWRAYYPGKFKKRLNKENIPSRAYIAFKDEEQLAEFSREYDGHMFRDKAGNESIAVVEFAPYQKIPSEKKKADGRVGTIEKDEDYISFLESLKDTSKPFDAENLDSLVAASQPLPQPTTTPLLEALKAEKSAQKDKETILRNHAHYKDQIALPGPSASKKDDTKKKGAATPQKPAEPPTSKKAAKKAAAKAAAANVSANAPAKPSGGAPAKQPAAPALPPAPKAPRPRRERQQPKPAAAPAPSGPSAPAAALADVSAALGDASAPAAPQRRTRPMLGLASRHFEAALSDAGVASGNRKTRRERELEKEKEKEHALPGQGAASNVSPKGKGKAEKRAAAGAPPIQPMARLPTALPPAPMILQRDGQQPPKILARPGDGAQGETGHTQDDGGGGRGGARGHGRGRGRGGPPR